MTIYIYEFDENEPIRQGDIFTNIPYLSYDLIVKSTYEDDKPLYNQNIEILSEVLKKGVLTQVETFISSTTAILASQDCDIRKDLDLIFFPLEKIKSFQANTIISDFNSKVRDTVVKFYLPKLNHPKLKTLGAFFAKFRIPLVIPYNLIIENIKHCWVARIKEPPRRFYIGKLTHFFSRPPIDEIIFGEIDEIIEYIERYKTKATNEIKRREFIKKVKEIKRALKSANRSEDLSKIPFDDLISF
ncbi:MAG: hypothetical protein ACFFD2_11635 [Promethearchaeota archaeon]